MHHRARDLTGQKLGYLTATRYAGAPTGRRSMWEVKCQCGKVKLMEASEFCKQQKRGILASCGCMKRASIGQRNTKHGMSAHPAYAVWRSMLDRCALPTHQAYHNYGARGIVVCKRWRESFDNFWADMGPAYQHGLTLERRNNNRGYSPANCKWATRRRQANNRRTSALLDTPAGRITVSQAARRYGLGRSTLAYRLAAGWGVPRALGLSST